MISRNFGMLIFTQNIVEDVFELPLNKTIRSDLLQRISRLSGALTQNFGENKAYIFLLDWFTKLTFLSVGSCGFS